MSKNHTPIPRAIIDRIPELAFADGKCPFDIRIQPFEEDGDIQMYSMDVWTEAVRVQPTDGRRNPHTEARLTTYFFDEQGKESEDPQSFLKVYRA